MQLDGHQLARLDDLAGERGVSRAALVRDAVDLILAVDARDKEVAAIVRSYTEDPPEDLTADPATRRAAWSD